MRTFAFVFLFLCASLGVSLSISSTARAQYGFRPVSQCFWNSYRGYCSLYNNSPYYPMYCQGSVHASTYRGFTYSHYGQVTVFPGGQIWAEVYVPNPDVDPAVFAWHSILCSY